MSDAHAASRSPWSPLSVEYLYFHALQRDKASPPSGATLKSTRAAVEIDGQPAETAWLYLASVPSDLAQWAPPKSIGDVFQRGNDLLGRDFASAWNCVDAGRPALLTMNLSDAFYRPSAAGVVDVSEPLDPQRRHAVVAVANGNAGGARFLLVRNSWGESWGLTGHAWLSEQYLGPRLMAVVAMKEIP